MKRRFSDLTPQQALCAAIAVERRNTTLYLTLAETFGSYGEGLASAFAAMAGEESKHREELELFIQQHFPESECESTEEVDVEEAIEAPDLDEPEVFIFDNVTLLDAIEMAERAEVRACEFYKQMAKEATHEGLRQLCAHMAEVEEQHRVSFTAWKDRVAVQPAQSAKS